MLIMSLCDNFVIFLGIKFSIDLTSLLSLLSFCGVKIFLVSKKIIVVIKNGDHSLSSKKNLKRITKELDKFVGQEK